MVFPCKFVLTLERDLSPLESLYVDACSHCPQSNHVRKSLSSSQSWLNTFVHVCDWYTYHIEGSRKCKWSPFFFPSTLCKLIKHLYPFKKSRKYIT